MPDAAEVVEIKTFGDWADLRLVGESVRHDRLSTSPEAAVASLIPVRQPQPAIVRASHLHLLPEAITRIAFPIRTALHG